MDHRLRTAWIMGLVLILSQGALSGERLFASVGTYGGNGKIPYLTLDDTAVDRWATLELHDASVTSNLWHLAISTEKLPGGGVFMPPYGPGAYFVPDVFSGTGLLFSLQSSTTSLYVPPDAAGLSFVCQGFVEDSGATGGIAFSTPLEFTLGDLVNLDDLHLEQAGFYHTLGDVLDSAVYDDTVYFLSQQFGVVRMDTTDPAAPKIAGYQEEFAADWNSECLSIDAGKGIVVGLDTLRTFEVLPDGSIAYRGVWECAPGDYFTRGVLSGNYAYVGCLDGPVKVFDLSSLSSPKEAASFPVQGYIDDMKVEGNRLFVHTGAKIGAYDLSDPLNPVLSYTLEGDFWIKDFIPYGEHLFLTDYKNDKLRCFKVSPTTQIEEIYTDDVYYCRYLHRLGDHLYLYSRTSGLNVYDLTNLDLQQVSKLGTVVPDGLSKKPCMASHGGYLYYYSSAYRSLEVVDDATLSMHPEGGMDLPSAAEKVCPLGDDRLVVSHINDGLAVYDIENPSKITEVYAYGERTLDVASAGNLIYAATGEQKVNILEVQGGAIQKVKEIGIQGCSMRVVVLDNVLWVGTAQGQVYLFDVSMGENPVLLTSLEGFSEVSDFVFHGDHAYILDSDGVYAVDMTEPSSSKVVGFCKLHSLSHLALGRYGHWLFSCDAYDGVSVLDITDPVNPVYVRQLPIEGMVTNVTFYKNIALFSEGYVKNHNSQDNGIEMVDVSGSDPYEFEIGTSYLDVYDENWDILFHDGHLYVADNACMLNVLDIEVQ